MLVKGDTDAMHEEKNLICVVCTKTFDNGPAYYSKKHLKSCKAPKPFKCEICGKKFKFARNLRMHKENLVEKCKPPKKKLLNDPLIDARFECDQCDRAFKSEVNLSVHKGKHSREIFKCRLCPENFAFLRDLTAHKKTHTLHFAQENKTCNGCGKEFQTIYTLENHLKNVNFHKDSPPDRLECQKCGIKDMLKYEFMKHINKIHKNGSALDEEQNIFECEKCGIENLLLSEFKQHIRKAHIK